MPLIYIDPHSVAAVTQYTDQETYWQIILKDNSYHLSFQTPGETDEIIARLLNALDGIKAKKAAQSDE